MTHTATVAAPSLLLRPLVDRSWRLMLLLALLTLLAGDALAQHTRTPTDGSTPLALQPGQPTGSFALSGFDNVNPYNGNLNFHLPLLGIGGRGDAQMTMMLAIDSKGWHVKQKDVAVQDPDCPRCVSYVITKIPEPNRWSPSVGYGAGFLYGRSTGVGANSCTNQGATSYGSTLTRLTFITPDGTEYELRDQLYAGAPQPVTGGLCNGGRVAVSRGTIFISADGNAATFVSDQPIIDKAYAGPSGTERIYPSGYLMLKDGSRYRIDGGKVTWLRDRNGNLLSFTYATNYMEIKDSLNRKVTVEHNITDVAPYGQCDRITYKGFGGAPRVIRVSGKSLSEVLRPGSGYAVKTYKQLFPELDGSSGTFWNPNRVSAVWLPDGRSYNFFYNSFGELARVELPTGGAFEYDHTPGSGCIDEMGSNCTDPSAELRQIFRRVTTRRVYRDAGTLHYGGTLDSKMTFSDPGGACALYPCQGDATITVDHFSGAGGRMLREKHYYYGNAVESLWQSPIGYQSWNHGREYKTETHDSASTDASPKVLRQVENTWAQRTPLPAWIANKASNLQPPFDVRLTQAVTTLLDTGTEPHKVSKQTFNYDQYNNQTDVYEYDYGDGVTGPFRRRTHTDYLTTNPVNGADYDSLAAHATSNSMSNSAQINSIDACSECEPGPDSAPPVADAGGPYSARAGTTITFNGNGSSDDIGVISYRWNFGDGTTVIEADATAWHEYAQAGTYTVTLTVYDEGGQHDLDSTTATISPPPTPNPTPTPTPNPNPTPTPNPGPIPESASPVADAGGPYSGPTGATITFNGSGSSDDIEVLTYRWNFGDGTTDTGVIAWHEYAQAGTYTVTLTVYDEDGQHDVDSTTATINLTPTPTPTPGTGQTDVNATIHIRNLPTQQWVSADTAGSQKKAITTYEYDNYTPDTFHAALLARSTISGLDAAFTTARKTRGNVTSVSRRLIQENRDITTYQQYDVAGNVTRDIDGEGRSTTFYFDDRFGTPGDNEAQSNVSPAELTQAADRSYAFATSVKNALNHISYTQYDYYTGEPVNTEDVNGTVYSGYYADALDRPTKLVKAYPDATLRTQTKFIYDDLNHKITTTSDRSLYDDDLLKSEMIYDGLGRTVETRQYEDATNYIRVDQQYDGLGRISKKSNPYRPLASPAETPLWTTTTYDELGRAIVVTTPDNAKVNTTYKGNTTTIRDQALKNRESTTDALGRLVEVVEDPNGSAYQTTYQYDVLDNLTKVLQGGQTRTFTYDSLKRLTQAVNPESGTIKYEYDDNGNLLKKIDPRKVTASPLVYVETTFAYDALDRVISKTYNDQGVTPNVVYKYDAQALPAGAPAATVFDRGASTGRLVSVTYGGTAAGTYYGYDGLGRVIERVQQTDGVNYEVDAAYNRAGAIFKETYPVEAAGMTRRIVTNTFDGAGRLASLATTGASVTGIKYASHGGLSNQSYGTLLHKITYDAKRLQPTNIKLEKSADATVVPLNLTYSYGTTNNNGNVLSASMTIGAEVWQQTFTYDSLNRLDTAKEVKATATQWSQNFDYDQYGNRCIRTSPTVICTPAVNGANNRLSGKSYDLAGNQLNDDADHTYTYDAENHIKTVDGEAAYVYDGEGNRVRKLLGENIRMVYGIRGGLIAEFDPVSGDLKKEYIYGASGLAATIAAGEGTRYVTADNLGTPRIITNATGAVVGRHDYQPFGEELFVGMGGRTSTHGYTSSGDSLRQKFTGKERDQETGLDYFLARYYSSMQGRFTSPDEFTGGPDELFDFTDDASDNPTFYADLTNPQSLNKYQYTYNNPINLTDPDGHCPDCIWDIANVVMGGASLVDNLQKGNYGSAVIDVIGLAIDGTATAFPIIPGGAGTIIKVIRGADKVADTAKTVNKADNAADAAKGATKGITAEKAENLAKSDAKGIPRDQLGPSGMPKIITKKLPTRKRAENYQQARSKGPLAKDVNPAKGNTHYHTTKKDGTRRKGKQNIHIEPRRKKGRLPS